MERRGCQLHLTAKLKKDLGVWISKDLTGYKQVSEQSLRAYKLLGYLKRNTRFILKTEVRRMLYLALGEQGMAQWWERSPPTSVARIQIPVSTPFVGWVCGWFLLGYDRFLSGYSGFPLSSKTNISNFQFDQESGRRRTTLWMSYLQIIIYLETLRGLILVSGN